MRWWPIALALAAGGCRASYRAHPLSLSATLLDGKALQPAELLGRPHAIVLWLPG